MPQPVDEKYPPIHNVESSLHTERLCLGKGIGADMSALNPSRQPLKHGPEPCWPTAREIFQHYLPSRHQQPAQFCEERHRIRYIMQRIRTRDQVKGIWRER